MILAAAFQVVYQSMTKKLTTETQFGPFPIDPIDQSLARCMILCFCSFCQCMYHKFHFTK